MLLTPGPMDHARDERGQYASGEDERQDAGADQTCSKRSSAKSDAGDRDKGQPEICCEHLDQGRAKVSKYPDHVALRVIAATIELAASPATR